MNDAEWALRWALRRHAEGADPRWILDALRDLGPVGRRPPEPCIVTMGSSVECAWGTRGCYRVHSEAPYPCAALNVDGTRCILRPLHDGCHFDGLGYWALGVAT
jgi:hypothetical protein